MRMAWCMKAKRRGRRYKIFLAFAALAAASVLPMPRAPAQTAAGGFGLGGSNANKPIDIESGRLEIDDRKHLAIFTGNVSATQGDYNLKAPRLEVTYESASQPQAGASAQPAKAAQPAKPPAGAASDPISGGQIKLIHATGGNVLLTSKKDDQEASGDDAVYDVPGQNLTMTGTKVVLSRRGSVIHGAHLTVDLATSRSSLVDRRVLAVITPQHGANPNAKKPIEIEAARLEADDKKQLAVFIGDVSATQGDYNLKSQRLEIMYEMGSQAAAKAAPAPKPVKPVKASVPSGAGDPLSNGQIKQIHASGGKVVLVNKKDGEEAAGDDAVYNVLSQKIVMTGKKVKLTQKGNATQGDKLTVDLASGQAKLDNHGRVSATFEQGHGMAGPFPEKQKRDEAALPQRSATPKPAALAPGSSQQSR